MRIAHLTDLVTLRASQEVKMDITTCHSMRPPGDLEQRQHSADETGSAVSLTVEYVSLDSAEAAATLCRQDEDAYRAACGREFRLRLKSPPKKLRNGGTPPTIREGYLDIITHASAMKRRVSIALSSPHFQNIIRVLPAKFSHPCGF